MQLRGEVFNLSFNFVQLSVTGTRRGFKDPQLHLARRWRQFTLGQMTQLYRLIGQIVQSIGTEVSMTYELGKKDQSLLEVPTQIILDNFTLTIYNKVKLDGARHLKDLEKTKILKVQGDKNEEKLWFSNGALLSVQLDNDSYIGPEAMVLTGPENLIIVWN